MRGIPDYLVCVNGKFVALELKRSKDELMRGTLQFNNVEKITLLAKGYATFVYPENWDKVKDDLKRMLKGA